MSFWSDKLKLRKGTLVCAEYEQQKLQELKLLEELPLYAGKTALSRRLKERLRFRLAEVQKTLPPLKKLCEKEEGCAEWQDDLEDMRERRTSFWTTVLRRLRTEFDEHCKGSLAWVQAQQLDYEAPTNWPRTFK
jgi:hypothetical protein